jgi:hypothetical protein
VTAIPDDSLCGVYVRAIGSNSGLCEATMPMKLIRMTRRLTVLSALLLAAAGCGSSDDDSLAPAATIPATAQGLSFSVTNSVATLVDGSLPAPAASFTGPVTTLSQRPTTTTSATISVAALEPFNTVLILPGGATQYVRISLPSTTTLIAVNVIGVANAPTTATALSVAVANGARVSQATPLPLLTLGN